MTTDLASEFSSRWRKSHRQEQRVFLQCPDEKQFGLLLGGHPQMEGLVVVDVLHSSVVREWNNQNPHCSIEAGMLVMEVNGIREPQLMLQQFREVKAVDLLLKCGLTAQQRAVYECSLDLHKKSLKAEAVLSKVPPPVAEDVGQVEVDVCSICYEDQDGGDEVSALPCGHQFHKRCVKKWLISGSMRCPLCNCDLSSKVPSPSSEAPSS